MYRKKYLRMQGVLALLSLFAILSTGMLFADAGQAENVQLQSADAALRRRSAAWQNLISKAGAKDSKLQMAARNYEQGRLTLELMDMSNLAQWGIDLGSGGMTYTNDEQGVLQAAPGFSVLIPKSGTSFAFHAPMAFATKTGSAANRLSYGADVSLSQELISPRSYVQARAKLERNQMLLLTEQSYQGARLEFEERIYAAIKEELDAEATLIELEREAADLDKKAQELKTAGYADDSAAMRNLKLKQASYPARKKLADRSLSYAQDRRKKLVVDMADDLIAADLPLPAFTALLMRDSPSISLGLADLAYRIAELQQLEDQAKESWQMGFDLGASAYSTDWKDVSINAGLNGGLSGLKMGTFVRMSMQSKPLVAGVELRLEPTNMAMGAKRKEQAALKGANALAERDAIAEQHSLLRSELGDAVSLWQLKWDAVSLEGELAADGIAIQKELYEGGFASETDVRLAELGAREAEINSIRTQIEGLELELRIQKALEL